MRFPLSLERRRSWWSTCSVTSRNPIIHLAPSVTAGEFIERLGQWVNGLNHGQHFKTTNLRIVPPTTLEGIEKYLGSGMVRGLGPHFAQKLVRAFGEAVFDNIEQTPERLLKLDGIGPKRNERVTSAWAARLRQLGGENRPFGWSDGRRISGLIAKCSKPGWWHV